MLDDLGVTDPPRTWGGSMIRDMVPRECGNCAYLATNPATGMMVCSYFLENVTDPYAQALDCESFALCW